MQNETTHPPGGMSTVPLYDSGGAGLGLLGRQGSGGDIAPGYYVGLLNGNLRHFETREEALAFVAEIGAKIG